MEAAQAECSDLSASGTETASSCSWEEFLDLVQDGDIDAVRQALESADTVVNGPPDAQSPFEVAMRAGFASLAEMLMNDSRFALDASPSNPLRICIECGYPDLACHLLRRGANPNMRIGFPESAFLLALRNEYLDLASEMLKYGAEVDVRDGKGWTPLIWAVVKGNHRVTRFLLENGAQVNAITTDGWNAVTAAFFKGDLELAQQLQDRGAIFGGKFAEAALLSSYVEGHLNSFYKLLELGAGVDISDAKGNSLLSLAVANADKPAIKALLDRSVDPNSRNQEGEPVLVSACKGGDLEIVQNLIRHGAAVNLVNKQGQTALGRAAAFNNLTVVHFLIDSGANVNSSNQNGTTPLMFAAKSGYAPVVRYLVESGANVEIEDNEGASARDMAYAGVSTRYDKSTREQVFVENKFYQAWCILS